jgi:hypothetical protein
MANVDRLKQAGLLDEPHQLTADEETKINQLSPAEVDALVSVHGKLGPDFFERKVPKDDGHRYGTIVF